MEIYMAATKRKSQLSAKQKTMIRRRVKAASPNGRQPEIISSLSEKACNDFLRAFARNNDNKKWFDRNRTDYPSDPLYLHQFDYLGQQRTIKVWGYVDTAAANYPIELDFTSDANRTRRLELWWRKIYEIRPGATDQLPPNVKLTVHRVALQIDFPTLDDPDQFHSIDLVFRVEIEAYVRLAIADGQDPVLKLTDFNVLLIPDPIADPLGPNSPIWRLGQDPACEEELRKMRLLVRDAFTTAANIALHNLTKSLSKDLPLPSLQVSNLFRLSPWSLVIVDDGIHLGADAVFDTALEKSMNSYFEQKCRDLTESFSEVFNSREKCQALVDELEPLSEKKRKQVFDRTFPVIKSLRNEVRVRSQHKVVSSIPDPVNPLHPDLGIMIFQSVFDKIAKKLLRLSKNECSSWHPFDIGVVYARARGCHWADASGAWAKLNGLSLSGGCDVKFGGGLEIQGCIRIPCLPDPCLTWRPGIGLAGPVDITLSIENATWRDNKSLELTAVVNRLPGIEVYGLPPIISEIVNWLLRNISEAMLLLFVNTILLFVKVHVVEVPAKIRKANIEMRIRDFFAANIDDYLVITGRPSFSNL